MTTPVVHDVLLAGGPISPRPLRPRSAEPPATAEAPPTHAVDVADARGTQPIVGDLVETLPHDTALLQVLLAEDARGDPCFRLHGYFRGESWAANDLAQQRRPEFLLADMLDRANRSHDVDTPVRGYESLIAWSITKETLVAWLTKLRREVGPRLRLIVWDDTNFGIPWELFYHELDEDSPWLGVAVQVIRWTTVHDGGVSNQFTAEPARPGRHGDILLFEHESLVTDQATSLCPRRPPPAGYEIARNLPGLLATLDGGPGAYALVYIRCHGTHSDNLWDAKLDDVALAQLNIVRMRALRQSGALVFLNTCNSARAVIDRTFADQMNRNFAEIFLRRKARGVIATLAEVPIAQSATLARDLVAEARTADVPLAERLRQHRERYAGKLPPHTIQLSPMEKFRIKTFLNASMFVYFGHPDTTFRLDPP